MMVTERASRRPVIGAAPGRLELVRAFVNTLDIEEGTDALGSPAALTAWLAGHGLPANGGDGPRPDLAAATGAHLAQAVALREALREILRAHVGEKHPAAAAVSDLDSLAAGLPFRLEVGSDGVVSTAPAGRGPVAGMAALLLIAAQAATLGTWARLKVCSADDCQWAFYDRSPTKSGCWCSMAVCGSRAKSRAYRRRTRS
jgi:predicted RNA-binding Zn ribbon-like protein